MLISVLYRKGRLGRIFATARVAAVFCKSLKTEVYACLSSLHTPATGNGPERRNIDYLSASDSQTEEILAKDMVVHRDFLTKEEEQSLLDEVEPYISRLKYEYDHWDNAIHGYRETERKHWTSKNKSILERVKKTAFLPLSAPLAYVHILDLAEDGYIKPHVDAIRFCGDTIAGLNLLSPCVMKLVHEHDQEKFGYILLEPRSLYIMRAKARYDYTHEVLPNTTSVFNGQTVSKSRRISVICRNEPEEDV